MENVLELTERLESLVEKARREAQEIVDQAKREAQGYDLLRYLKRAEAEVMDLLHNLSQAQSDLP